MKCNVGKTEQLIRIGAGVGLITIGYCYRKWWGLLGILPVITGSARYCPVNEAMGISTCHEEGTVESQTE